MELINIIQLRIIRNLLFDNRYILVLQLISLPKKYITDGNCGSCFLNLYYHNIYLAIVVSIYRDNNAYYYYNNI